MFIKNFDDGYQFEKEIFDISSREIAPFIKHYFNYKHRRYRQSNFLNDFLIVKNIQEECFNWDPGKPHTEIGRILLQILSRYLRDGRGKVKLFCALGTPMDYRGVDCFFEKDGYIVTIDWTISKEKTQKKKHVADFVISANDLRYDEHYKILKSVANSFKSIKNYR